MRASKSDRNERVMWKRGLGDVRDRNHGNGDVVLTTKGRGEDHMRRYKK